MSNVYLTLDIWPNCIPFVIYTVSMYAAFSMLAKLHPFTPSRARFLGLLQLQDADRYLESFCGRMPASSLLPTLMRAQMALEAGNLDAGSQLLNLASAADPRVSRAGGVVATQVALLEQVSLRRFTNDVCFCGYQCTPLFGPTVLVPAAATMSVILVPVLWFLSLLRSGGTQPLLSKSS